MARLKVKQIVDFDSAVAAAIASNDTNDAASITSLATAIASEQSLQDASINSLELEVQGGTGALGDSVDSLESAVSAVASDLSDYESATDVSINSLEAVDGTLAASVDSLETLAGEAFGSGLRVHQMGTIISATEFTLPSAVDAGANSDIVVFVNGKNEQMFGVNGNSNGWSTPDGQNFTFTGIGYNLDLPGVNELGDDEVYVIAPLAGNGAGSGVDTGDYNDFEAAR